MDLDRSFSIMLDFIKEGVQMYLVIYILKWQSYRKTVF